MSVFKNKTAQREGFAIDTLIGPDMTVRGDLEFSGGLYVEGRVIGKVLAVSGKPASLVLGESGSIEGEVHVPVVIVNGSETEMDDLATVVLRGSISELLVELVDGLPAFREC